MSSLPKTNPTMARKGRIRKPVSKLQQSRLQVSGVRSNPSRRDRATRTPDTGTGAGLLIEESAGTETDAPGAEVGRPADRLISAETIAAAAALDSPAGQAANVAPDPSQGAPLDSAPPAGETTIEQCTADAAELIEFAWSSIEAAGIALPPRTRATLEKQTTRDGIATAAGRLFHHYGLAGTDIIANPWAGLALALSPVVFAGFIDWREMRATAASQAKAATPTPSAVDAAVSSPVAPPSNLTARL